MIRIAVVDLSAQSRNRLVEEINRFVKTSDRDINLIPRISIRPYAPQELKFHAIPEVVVVGPEIVESDLVEVSRIKAAAASAAIVVRLPGRTSLSAIDHLARMGADDVLAGELRAQEFLQKIIFLSRRKEKISSGKLLLVDSGKGGLGVTSIVAAMGEALFTAGKQVALIDLDTETQDLSRFLQVRPFVNENLRLILDEQRPVLAESVRECIQPVWSGEEGLMVLSPAAESEDLFAPGSSHVRTMLSLLGVLDEQFDCVIVDCGCARGELRRMLYRAADGVVFVVNNDPATFYASVERLNKARASLSASAQLLLIENSPGRKGLANDTLRSEFSRVANLDEAAWCKSSLAFSPEAARWPASGATLFSLGRGKTAAAVEELVCQLGLVEAQESASLFTRLINRLQTKGRKEQSGSVLDQEGVQPSLETRSTLKQLPEPQLALVTEFPQPPAQADSEWDLDEAKLVSAARVG